MTPIVLASLSATRATILRNAGVPFAVAPSGVDENAVKASMLENGQTPAAVASALAAAKATTVSMQQNGLVIGADQTLEMDGHLYDKPETLQTVRARLLLLRGRSHTLHTSVCVAQSGAIVWRHDQQSVLEMRSFTEQFIDDYVDHHGEELMSSVGAYQLEHGGIQLFDRIDGDFFTILGLPLLPLLNFLRQAGGVEA